jgi:hypothetical protein
MARPKIQKIFVNSNYSHQDRDYGKIVSVYYLVMMNDTIIPTGVASYGLGRICLYPFCYALTATIKIQGLVISLVV